MTEESLFHAALERAPGEDRLAFLRQCCAGDDALFHRVEQLLAAYSAAQSKLEPPTGPIAPDHAFSLATEDHCAASAPGVIIAGRYRLLDRLGEGGMGEVWVASQTEPVKRRVALKLIRTDRDSRQVVARFEAERQALALMDHPNIARVLDGGQTESGRPFFVMELVNGLPLTRFCDEMKLTPRERLELFVPICQAVQHAHSKGIIHRDLKPSNILVTLYDGKPVPKVIDFGVAKATGGRLTDESLATQFGAVIGTFEYMAPEQAGFSALDVDTRGDLYSLGVILYELLTGLRPFDAGRLRRAALDEMVRILREEEPPKPSTRLTSDESAPTLAALRQTDPKRLAALMRGELDWVVMKCLEKDRNRRYETANGLARDVQRYLADEPVEARPPSAGYRVGKFVRRNRGPVLAAAMMALLLVVGATVSAWQAWRATVAEGVAEERRGAAEEAEREAKDERDEAEKQRRRAEQSLYIANMNRVRFEMEHNNIARARALLNLYRRPASPERDLRGWEWYYWDRMCQGELYTLKWPEGLVTSMAFSTDGAVLAAAGRGKDPTIKLWDVVTGREVLTLRALKAQPAWLAFAPDGRTLLSLIGNGDVKFWDVPTGKELPSFAPPRKGTFGSVALSPDGKALACEVIEGRSRSIRFWDIGERKWKGGLPESARVAVALRYSPDGRRLAHGHQEGVTLWDLERRTALYTFQGHAADMFGDPVGVRERLRALAFSPDGRALATGGGDGTTRVYDLQTGKETRAITVMPTSLTDTDGAIGVADLTFTPDSGRLITAGDHGSLKSWLVGSGHEERSFFGHAGVVLRLAISPDGLRLASAGPDGIKVWDAAAGPTHCLSPGRFSWTERPVFSPDGKLLAVSINRMDCIGQVEVRSVDEAKPSVLLDQGPGIVSQTAFSPDGKVLASVFHPQSDRPGPADKVEIRLWSLESGQVIRSIPRLKPNVWSPRFSPGGESLAFAQVSWDFATRKHHGEVKVCDLAGTERQSFPGIGLAFSPDGRTLAIVGADKVLKLVDRNSGQELRAMQGRGSSTFVAFSLDGKKLYFDGTVWEAATGRDTCRLEGRNPIVRFSPDGKRLFSLTSTFAATGHLRVWDAVTGDLLLAVPVPGRELDVHPDGFRLVVSGRNTAVWVIDARPLTPGLRQEHEARNLVAHLFRKPMLRDEVIAFLRRVKTVAEPVRRQALAQGEVQEHDSETLNFAATEIVIHSDRSPEDYRKALKWAEEACRVMPTDGPTTNTLGLALYYTGKYEEAEKVLRRAFELNRKRPAEHIAAYDLLFLAMAQSKLGRHEDARDALKRARDPKLGASKVLPRHWREAEALIEGKKP